MIARPICRAGSINTLRSAACFSSSYSAASVPLFRSVSTFSSLPTKTRLARRAPTTTTAFVKTRLANRNFFATMAANVPYVTLNDGNKMPQVGFGLWKVDNDTCADTVYNAIKAGYRLFDGACGTYNPVQPYSFSPCFFFSCTPLLAVISRKLASITAKRPELPVAAVHAWLCIGTLASCLGTTPIAFA